jgi:hypothetical protein
LQRSGTREHVSSKGEPQAQQGALKIWIDRSLIRAQAQAIAAAALRQYLAGSPRADLSEAYSVIRAAMEELRQNQL